MLGRLLCWLGWHEMGLIRTKYVLRDACLRPRCKREAWKCPRGVIR